MQKKYSHQIVEKKWQERWEKKKPFRALGVSRKEKRYVLDMFPYPSAEGLHVGHPEGYTASDIYSRYLRMKGFEVLHPMGFDAFGLPAENYALKTGTHPAVTSEKNVKNIRRQIKSLGFSYDWDREVTTTDSAYYKWTQWIFLQLFKHGLAYEAEAPINWCPSCKTGLANEEVVGGKCERCGTAVTKKKIKQWLVKITDSRYIERLLHGLDKLDWPENIKLLQRNWIGRSEGALVFFRVIARSEATKQSLRSKEIATPLDRLGARNDKIEVFTTRPDTLFGATYLVLAPEHPLVKEITVPEKKKEVETYVKKAQNKSDLDRTDLAKEKTGVFIGAYAVNPVNNEKIPVWVADYVLLTYGTGAIMAVPAHDERDFEFAKKYHLPIKQVIQLSLRPPRRSRGEAISGSGENEIAASPRKGVAPRNDKVYTGYGIMINSGQFDKLPSKEGGQRIVEWLRSKTDRARNTCLVVHGVSGHKKENWFPWLKKELTKIGWDAIVPTMPGAGHPTLDSWNNYLGQYDQQINENSVLVGHSLGCASILYYLQESGKKVDTVIFVAPTNPLQNWPKLKLDYPDNDWDAVEKINAAKNFDWKKIRPLAKRFIILYSDNDPYIPSESMAYYQKNLPQAKVYMISGKYHFSENGGIRSLPEILPFFPDRSLVQAGAKASVNYKLRDWLFSRQRYWGEPIPIVHCEKCGNAPVPEKNLPLELPKVKNYQPTGTGESPLAAIDKWVNTKCPNCGGKAKRETNTMPQWAGSNWYFLRYCDPKNDKKLADPKKLKQWLPVDLYVGGAEHAVLHLLYARFIYKFLFDIGAVPKECGEEPFIKLKNQGLILGEDGQKMSKSRGNVINPDEVVKKYGADTIRMYEMFMGPFNDAKPWNTQGMVGVYRFLDRVWRLVIQRASEPERAAAPAMASINRKTHQLIKKISEDINSFKFNTSVSSFMSYVNDVMDKKEGYSKTDFEVLLILLAPFAPHIAEELWEKLGHNKSIFLEKWPKYDTKMIVEDVITVVIQINGKVRDQMKVVADINEEEVKKLALKSQKVQKWLNGQEPKKMIYAKGRLVSIVI